MLLSPSTVLGFSFSDFRTNIFPSTVHVLLILPSVTICKWGEIIALFCQIFIYVDLFTCDFLQLDLVAVYLSTYTVSTKPNQYCITFSLDLPILKQDSMSDVCTATPKCSLATHIISF